MDYKKGNIVKINKCTSGHPFDLGTFVLIEEVIDNDTFLARNSTFNTSFKINKEDIELVIQEPVDNTFSNVGIILFIISWLITLIVTYILW